MTLKLMWYVCATAYFYKNSTTSPFPEINYKLYGDNYNSLIQRYYVNKPINLNNHNHIFPLKCTDNLP